MSDSDTYYALQLETLTVRFAVRPFDWRSYLTERLNKTKHLKSVLFYFILFIYLFIIELCIYLFAFII